MRWILLVEISISLLRSRLKQTIVAAVGVVFGVGMFITLLSFMNGLNGVLDGLIINRTPHVKLFNEVKANDIQAVNISENHKNTYNFINSIKAEKKRQEIYNYSKIVQTLQKDTRIKSISGRISSQVFFTEGGVDIAGFMHGIDVRTEMNHYFFKDYVTLGNPIDLENLPNSIILGKPLADKLLAKLGDVIQITTITGENFQMKVVGYYQSGISDYDKTQSFASLKTVQKILGKPKNYITDLSLKVNNLEDAPQMAKEFANIFELSAEDIQTSNAQFSTGSKIRTIISYAVGITLLTVAGFGIYNILNMMIYEKMDTIAILKATGFSGNDVMKVFMFISITIGLMGCVGGLLMANLLTFIISNIPFNTPALPTIKTFPIDFNPVFYIIAIVFSLVTTFFAGWFPARKASQVDPVIIIRGK